MSETSAILTVLEVAAEAVEASPFQARRFFDEEKVRELAESVRQHGVLNPLIVRAGKEPGRYELIAGERRLRAVRVAGLATVPVLLRTVTDLEAEEMMLTENLQREDLRPTEEAEACRGLLALRDEQGEPMYTRESLALRLGKEAKYVIKRLKLLDCPEELQEAVNAGTVAVGVGILVGRIPEERARKEAARRVLRPLTQEIPLSYEQAKEMIHEEFLRSLSQCGFDQEDAALVPVKLDEEGNRLLGGACTDCPFRSGNMLEEEELFAAGTGRGSKAGVAVNLCTKPGCYGRKQEAAWRVVRRQAEEGGLRVLEGDMTRGIFRSTGAVDPMGPYVDAGSPPTVEEIGMAAQENRKSWKTLLAGQGVDVLVVRHPVNGRVLTMMDRKEAVRAWERLQEGGGEVSPAAVEPSLREAVGSGLDEDVVEEEDGEVEPAAVEGRDAPLSVVGGGLGEEKSDPVLRDGRSPANEERVPASDEEEEEDEEEETTVEDVWHMVKMLLGVLRKRPQVEVLERCFAPLRARYHLMAAGESEAVPMLIQSRLMNPEVWAGVPYPGLSWALVFALAAEVCDPEADHEVVYDVIACLKEEVGGVEGRDAPLAVVALSLREAVGGGLEEPLPIPLCGTNASGSEPLTITSLPFEAQVRLVVEGKATIPEVIGKKPGKEDKEAMARWSRDRAKMRRAVAKGQEDLAAEIG